MDSDWRRHHVEWLRAFDALLETRHVPTAASQLGWSKPAMSGALARLREELGDPVFVRNGSRIALTPVADSAAWPIRAVLEEIDTPLRIPYDPGTDKYRFVFAAPDFVYALIASQLAKLVFEEIRGISLNLTSPFPSEAGEALRRGHTHLAIAPPGLLADGCRSQVLFSDRWLCAIDEGHAQRAGTPDLARYLELRYIELDNGLPDPRQYLEPKPRAMIVFHGQGFLSVPGWIRETESTAFLPESLARAYPALVRGLRLFPPPFEVRDFELALHWHSRNDGNPRHRWMRETVLEILGDALLALDRTLAQRRDGG